jgi:hypothetical protein
MGRLSSAERVAFKYGIYTFIGLVAYFLLMKALGLHHNPELRVFNFFIMFAGIWWTLKWDREDTASSLSYVEKIGLGVLAVSVAVIPFAIFIFAYLKIDTEFMLNLKATESFGQYLNPYILSFLIAFEGIASGAIVSFGMMQYFKRSHMSGV